MSGGVAEHIIGAPQRLVFFFPLDGEFLFLQLAVCSGQVSQVAGASFTRRPTPFCNPSFLDRSWTESLSSWLTEIASTAAQATV
jgi:hypothetical protein